MTKKKEFKENKLKEDKKTHPSSQVFGYQRHQQAGGGQQRAPLRHQLHLHEAHLAVEPGQSQRVHARAHTLAGRQHSEHSGDSRAQTLPSHPDRHTALTVSVTLWHTPWHSVWGSGTGWGCWCQTAASAGCWPPWRSAPPSCTRRRKCRGSRRHRADCAPAGSPKHNMR